MKRLPLICLLLVATVYSLAADRSETAQAQTTFYVHAASGNDANDGALKTPWKSLEKARDSIRLLKKNGSFPASGVVVELTGTFQLSRRNFVLDERDGGTGATSPVVYRASPSGAELIGGYVLSSDGFKPIGDRETLARLPETARGKVSVFDLKTLGLESLPALPRQFRGWNEMELFFGGKAMTVARWPNSGWVEIDRVIDRGVRPVDKATGEWEHGYKGGTFTYKESSPSRWDVPRGVWLNGFWCFDWANETLKVAAINRELKQITTEGIHTYGIGNARNWQKASRRWFALNLLEELDMPGEWYLDRAALKLYFYPPGTRQDEIVLSSLRLPMIEVRHSAHIRLEKLRLRQTIGDAVQISDCKDVVADSLVVTNTADNGIVVRSGSECGVRDCRVSSIGGTGITLSGGDRRKLVSCGHFAVGNEVHRCGRLMRTGGYCVSFTGVGCRVAHNLIYDCPYIAVMYGGNDHRFEYNEVHSAMMEGGDGGAIYTGRDWSSQGNMVVHNYIHHCGQAGFDRLKALGQTPEYEPLKKDVAIMGVYLDDCDSGDTVRDNIFYKTGYAVFVGGGRDNLIENNLIVDCLAAVHFDDRGLVRARPGEGTKDGWDLLAKLETVDYKNPPWSVRFPNLVNVMEDEPKLPMHNVVRANVSIDCRKWLSMASSAVRTSLSKIEFADNVVWGTLHTRDRELFPEPGAVARVFFPKEPLVSKDANKDTRNDARNDGFDRDGFAVQTSEPVRKFAPRFKPIRVDEIGLSKKKP